MDNVYRVTRGGFAARKGQRKSPQDKTLSPDEFASLLEISSSDTSRHGRDAYDLFSLSGNFGLRCSECLDLDAAGFSSVGFGYFRVSTLKKKGDQEDRVYTGKDGASLVKQIVERRKGHAHLFPFSTRTARYLFAFYAKQAGISPNVSFHSLRHTAARMMWEATKEDRIVNAFLRHKPTTTHIYLTPSAEEMTNAMEKKGIVR